MTLGIPKKRCTSPSVNILGVSMTNRSSLSNSSKKPGYLSKDTRPRATLWLKASEI